MQAKFYSLEQAKEDIDAEIMKQETQAAIETLQDLQSQFEAVSSTWLISTSGLLNGH